MYLLYVRTSARHSRLRVRRGGWRSERKLLCVSLSLPPFRLFSLLFAHSRLLGLAGCVGDT
jgi:hypothetical protein